MIFKCQREMVKVNMIAWQEGPAGRQRDFVGKEGSVYRTLWKKQTWGRSGVNHLVGAAVLRDLVLGQESLELQPGARTVAGPRGTWALCRGRSVPRSRHERQAGAGTLPSCLGHSQGAGGTFLGLFVAVLLLQENESLRGLLDSAMGSLVRQRWVSKLVEVLELCRDVCAPQDAAGARSPRPQVARVWLSRPKPVWVLNLPPKSTVAVEGTRVAFQADGRGSIQGGYSRSETRSVEGAL